MPSALDRLHGWVDPEHRRRISTQIESFNARIQLLYDWYTIVDDSLNSNYTDILSQGTDLVSAFLRHPTIDRWHELNDSISFLIDEDLKYSARKLWHILLSSPLFTNITQRALQHEDFEKTYANLVLVCGLVSLLPSQIQSVAEIRASGALLLDLRELLLYRGNLIKPKVYNTIMISYISEMEQLYQGNSIMDDDR